MEILGHRGRPSPDTPENTVAAVQAALREGADGVEVDVRLTADGVAVCCHDAGLDRVAGVARGVRSLTLAELGAVRVAGHSVPTVAEVIAGMAGRGRLALDLKPEQRPRALLAAVAEAVAGTSGPLPQLVLSSFDGAVLEACAAMAARVERAVILTGAEPSSRILAQAVGRGDAALHVPARTVFAGPDLVSAAHAQGLAVRVLSVVGHPTRRGAAGPKAFIPGSPSNHCRSTSAPYRLHQAGGEPAQTHRGEHIEHVASSPASRAGIRRRTRTLCLRN